MGGGEKATGGLFVVGGFDDGGHASGAAFDLFVFSVGVDLVSFEFGAFFRCGIDDDAAGGIDLASHEVGSLPGVAEELAEHSDDVVIGMVVVIEEDDVPHGVPFWDFLGFGPGGIRGCDGGCFFSSHGRTAFPN